MRLTIRTRFFLGMVAVSLSFILLSLLVMDRFIGRIAENEVTSALRRGLRAYERFAELRYDLIATLARSTAQAPHLRRVMNIPEVDHETVFYTAGELDKVVGADLMLLVDTGGKLIADVGDPERWGTDLSGFPGVGAGLDGREFTGVWRYQGHPYWVALTPIVLGDQLLGLLVLGDCIDATAAAEIREFTGKDVLIFQEGRMIAQSRENPRSLPVVQDELVPIAAAWQRTESAVPFRAVLGGEEVLAVAVPLGDSAGHALLFRALDELESGVEVLRAAVLAAGGTSIILAIILGLWLSARVSRPIRRLSDAAEQFGAGKLSTRVEEHSRNELGQLAHSFNLMVAQIEERTDALRREVTERLQAEENMRRSERYFRSLIENASDIIAVVDREGAIQYISPSVERILGHDGEGMAGKKYFDHVHPDDLAKVEETHSRTCGQAAAPLTCEFRMQHASGAWHIVQAVFNNQIEDRAVAGIVVNIQDVTERKQAEMRLAQARKLESIGRLAAGIAHEINSPMQFIGDNTHFLQQAFAELRRVQELYAELLEKSQTGSVPAALLDQVETAVADADLDFLAAKIPQALQRSQEGVERVSQLVGAMKEFSHPGTKEQAYVDLNRTIESAVVLSRNEWKYLAEMELDLDRSLPQVRCLPGEISQVLVNLIVNAAHAIGDANGTTDGANDGKNDAKGTIAVSTRLQGDRVEVRLHDTGPGIPEGVQQHIFDPFFTTKEVGKGTGQGLAIAHDTIATRHGGELYFETRQGMGTTFVIRLPVNGHEDPPAESET